MFWLVWNPVAGCGNPVKYDENVGKLETWQLAVGGLPIDSNVAVVAIGLPPRVDEILTEKIHAEKLQRFEELKSAIESGRMSTDLGELKNYLIEIDEGIFGFVPDPEKL